MVEESSPIRAWVIQPTANPAARPPCAAGLLAALRHHEPRHRSSAWASRRPTNGDWCWSRSGANDWSRCVGSCGVDRRGRRPSALEHLLHLRLWLLERIDPALEARRLVGEGVSPERNARDQIAAFRVHVERHQPHLAAAWLALPDPDPRCEAARAGQTHAGLALIPGHQPT